jgi:hypothetical protein
MNRIKAPIFLLLLALLLAGCVAIPVEPSKLAHIKRIGVVSALGSDFDRKYIGFTMFTNEQESFEISAWGLNERIERNLKPRLEQAFNATAVEVNADRAAFEAIHPQTVGERMFAGQDWDKVAEPIRSICSTNRLDALMVVIGSRDVQDWIIGTNQLMQEYGVWSNRNYAWLYLNARAVLVDCRDLKDIASRGFADKTKYSFLEAHGPHIELDKKFTKLSIDELSDADKDELRKALETLIDSTSEPTISTFVAPNQQ